MQLLERSHPLLAAVLLGGLAACATTSVPTPAGHLAPGRVEPSSPADARALQSLEKLPAGSELTLGDTTLAAQAPYHAASGRICRALTPQGSDILNKLACQLDDGWTLVPVVFPTVIQAQDDDS